MMYDPQPICTDQVRLTPEILELIELLAQSNHDVWAQQRSADGWKFGPRRDDGLKEHPGLVPYADLTEAEKEYDRKTVMETLKAIIALGYRIEKNTATGSRA